MLNESSIQVSGYTLFQQRLERELSNYQKHSRESLIQKLQQYLPKHHSLHRELSSITSTTKLRTLYKRTLRNLLRGSYRISQSRKHKPDYTDYLGICREYTREMFPIDHYFRREYVKLPLPKCKSWVDRVSEMPKDKQRNLQNAFRSIKELIESLFITHNRILVLRIDLFTEELDLVKVNSSYSQLLTWIQNTNKHYIAMFCSREYTVNRGIHLHCYMFLDGSKDDNGFEFVGTVREKWKKLENGSVYCANWDKKNYPDESEILGIIRYTDIRQIEKLIYIARYLLKDLTERDWLLQTGNNPKSRLFTCTPVVDYPSKSNNYHETIDYNGIDNKRKWLVDYRWIRLLSLRNRASLFSPKSKHYIKPTEIVRLNPYRSKGK